MKKIHIISAFIALFSITAVSCSDYLDEKLKSELAPDNTYTSSYGFETGSAGMYAIARAEYNTWGSTAFMHSAACPYESQQIATDLAIMGTKDGSIQPFGYCTLTSNTGIVTSTWKWAYSLIAAANEVLAYAEKNTNWDKPTDQATYIAEARFFRAYAYRTLVYLYGDVTYVDKIQETIHTDFTRTPKAEVIQHMLDDLNYASEHLPVDPDNVPKVGKLTKWAAEHLLSEVYLMNGDNANAEKSALNVINSGYFRLMSDRFGVEKNKPGDVFADLFKEYNQNRTSGNMESIWVMQFEYQTKGGGDAYDDWTRRAWEPKYFEIQGFTLADTLGGRGLCQLVPLKWWIGDDAGFFDATDIRNSEYNIKRHWYYNNPKTPNMLGKRCEITDETWFTTYRLYPALVKFFYGKADNLTYTGTNRDRMKFRLAETYLLLAEARFNKGDMSGAAEALNVVRRRAHASEITSGQMTIDVILDERIRELVGEESRRFTLCRTGKLLERCRKYNTEAGPLIQDYNVLWPIPQEVIDSNTGTTFSQNFGY